MSKCCCESDLPCTDCKASEGSCCWETWKGLGKEQEDFRVTSPHTARAGSRIIPPLNLLQTRSYVCTAFYSVQSLLCWCSGRAESCVLVLPVCWAPWGRLSALASHASQQLEQDEISSPLYVRRLPVSAEKWNTCGFNPSLGGDTPWAVPGTWEMFWNFSAVHRPSQWWTMTLPGSQPLRHVWVTKERNKTIWEKK